MYLKLNKESKDLFINFETGFFFSKEKSLSDFSTEELNTKLEKAVANENYELAVKIRDEISKRI